MTGQFQLTDDQLAIQDMARKFTADRITPFAAQWDEDHHFPRDVVQAAGELGFGSIYVSEESGGIALGRLEAALIMEAMAYGCPATSAYISIHNMATWMIDRFGGAEIKARHTFSEASLCLDATIAGQGVMLAWQTIASHQLQHGQLVAPFGPAVKTGFGHYFVTAENARRSEKVEKFKRWLKREIEDDMERLAKAAPVFA